MSKREKRIGFTDWFSRDADYGYTYYDPKYRTVNWDRGYANYSDFFFGRNTGRVKMDEAAELLSTMSRVMGVHKRDFTCTASVKSTKLAKVAIPAHMLAEGKSMDVFIGASLQNMARYVHQSLGERSAISDLGKGKMTVKKMIKAILNDERVNKLMSKETPGYLKFIQKYKEDTYKNRPQFTAENDGQHLMDLFDRIIRYPENITEEELEKFSEPIAKIKEILNAFGGIPETYKDCDTMSTRISKVVENYMHKSKSPESKGSDGGGSGDDSDSDDDSSDDSSDDSESDDTEEKSAEQERYEMSKYLEQMINHINNDGSSEKMDSDLEHEQFQAFMEELATLDETSKTGVMSKVDVIKVVDDPHSRKSYASAIKAIDLIKANVLATLMRRKNRDYQFSMKSMRTGRLDTNKLAEAVQGVSTIYERIGQVKTDKLCVVVLVDESGSMSYEGKELAARQAAIFLDKALAGVRDVELFIYGHTADWTGGSCGVPNCKGSGTGSTQLLVYKEPGITTSSTLGHMSGRYENRDGTAIIAAAKRVRSMTPNNGVFVIISDGEPHANNYHGHKATKHVRNMAIATEQMGFEVIQVTIGGHRSHDMFKQVINIDSITDFPDKFVGFLRKKVNKMIKEKVTL